ncbi:uncharacterized protein KRP23_8959 [Phytophthora ramorum]|uniref:uncharacterized protein n=1 Tax=Phytophthora ramorum TaxID=164328 RepID=UPI0030A8F8BC|nr:hypothetical protein KRP23_8959 [Phytophthora ramorum]
MCYRRGLRQTDRCIYEIGSVWNLSRAVTCGEVAIMIPAPKMEAPRPLQTSDSTGARSDLAFNYLVVHRQVIGEQVQYVYNRDKPLDRPRGVRLLSIIQHDGADLLGALAPCPEHGTVRTTNCSGRSSHAANRARESQRRRSDRAAGAEDEVLQRRSQQRPTCGGERALRGTHRPTERHRVQQSL